MNNIGLFFFISLIFSPLAAGCAYIITFEEYKKHLKKKEAMKQSFQSAIFAFVVFMIIGTLAGYLFSNVFSK